MIILHGKNLDGSIALCAEEADTVKDFIGSDEPLHEYLKHIGIVNALTGMHCGVSMVEMMPTELFIEEYGTWENYLRAHGVSPQ